MKGMTMKKMMLLVLAAALALPLFGCKKKEPTLGEKLDAAVEGAADAAAEAKKEAKKALE
jgi:Sec-independent protein translocase protein TatA